MNDPTATRTPSAYGGDADDKKIRIRIIENYTPRPGDADDEDYRTDISDSGRAVEKLLDYSFKDKRLLEEALTHPSYTDSASYQRLEWLGDSALGLAVSNFLFSAHPDLQPGQLSLLRSANTSTEKLARAAVREFALAVQEEDDTVVHEGAVKAPKVLADIVESVAGAVYVDCKLDLQVFWAIFRRLLEPIVDPETLWKQPQPVTLLYELCQKDGRKVDFKFREEEKDTAVYVDGELIASASTEIQAARAALKKLCLYECNGKMDVDYSCIYGTTEIEEAKQKLYALCGKKRWRKPYYGIVEESGPIHEKRYVCSVEIDMVDKVLHVKGDEKSRVKDAENSAASWMIQGLQESKFTLWCDLDTIVYAKIHKRIIENYTPGPGDADDEDYRTDISDSVRAVEKLLDYSFKSKRLLEEALTHSSYTDSASYQRLEWLGDSALGLAVSNFLFSAHPDLQPGQLSLLRSANTSTEKLARAAVLCRLHCYFRHHATALDGQVREFALAVQKEDDMVVHGGAVKAPKVLADIVESVAGAVYVDCKLDLQVLWAVRSFIFRRLLEPIVDPETLWKQPQPVTLLYELCQKDGRKVDFKFREEEKDTAVYVDRELIASASSEIQAASAALKKLCLYKCNSKMDVDYTCIYGTSEIEGAKQKLHALCGKKR
ncbi:hypothetical protein RHGRI_009466 [Rhododendron griersonianum]|uniref:Uncharacterized protein n=1 Tax=Rhododendron griersonianum TaxID=479676 RepID=A0AAV6KFG9_9ERIC|nr:hypothetical protein RHGRI_009466 [Rhododendron griersonianum]